MKTFQNVSEAMNKRLIRCAGFVRKEGWPVGAVGMYVALCGPTFVYDAFKLQRPGYYPKLYIEQFMEWQEENFS